jgi:hypothetical protein
LHLSKEDLVAAWVVHLTVNTPWAILTLIFPRRTRWTEGVSFPAAL